MATELGVGYLSIVPETSRLAPAITRAMRGISPRVDVGVNAGNVRRDGARAGQDYGDGFTGSLRGALGRGAGLIGLAGGATLLADQLKSSVTTCMYFTTTLNTMQAVAGASAAELAKVTEKAKELGTAADLPNVSANDAAAAMTELAKGGFSVQQSMDAAKGSLQLAGAAGIGAAEAATIQSQALQAFGKEASFAGKTADILANSANASSAEITDVAQALQASGTVANQFGLSMEDTAAAIGMFANKGIQGSDAGTLLKSALLALTDQGNPAQGAIEELGLKVYDAQGRFVGLSSLMGQLGDASKKMSAEQYQAATATLFGSDAMRLAGIAATDGSKGFDSMRQAVDRQGAAADVAAAKTQGLPGAWAKFQNTLEDLQLKVYGFIQGPISSLLNGLSAIPNALKDMFGWLGQFSGVLVPLTAAVAGGAVAYGAYALSLGVATGATGVFASATAFANAAVTKLLLTLAFNPFVAIGIAVAAAIAGLVAFFRYTETGRKIWASVWGFIKTTTAGFVDWFKSNVLPVLSTVWNGIKAGAEVAWGGIKAVFSWIGDAFTGLFNLVAKGDFTGALTRAFGLEEDSAIVSGILFIRDAFTKSWDFIVEHFGNAWDNIKSKFSGIKEALDPIISKFRELWAGIGQKFGEVWAKIQPVLSQLWDKLKEIAANEQVQSIFKGIAIAVAAIAALPFAAIGIAIGAVVTVVMGLLMAVSWVIDKITKYWPTISTVIEAVWSVISVPLKLFWGAVKGLWNVASSVVSWIVDNWPQISAVMKSVWDIISEPLSQFWDAVKKVWDVAMSVVNWFQENWPIIKAVILEMWDQVKDIWDTFTDKLQQVKDKATQFKDALVSAFGWVKDKSEEFLRPVTNLINTVKDGIGGVIDKVSNLPGVSAIMRSQGGPAGFATGGLPGFAGGSKAGISGSGVLFGPGTTTSDSILAMLSKGEFIVNAKQTAKFLPLLQAINSGGFKMPGFASGGRIDDVMSTAKSIQGASYGMGSFSTSSIDCSGFVSAIANTATGRAPFESRMSTVTEGSWLQSLGFKLGRGSKGDLQIGWWDQGGGANGHTAGTLPDGTNFESNGSDGAILGGKVGADDPQFTQHAYLPAEALGGNPNAGGSGSAPSLAGMASGGSGSGGSGGGSGFGGGGSTSAFSSAAAAKQGGVVPVWVENWPSGSSSLAGASVSSGSSPADSALTSAVTANTSAQTAGLSKQQQYADAIVAEGKRRGISEKGIVAALATVQVETGFKMYANNADPESLKFAHDAVGSDADSSGLFQQRNNGAWGTIADRMDPAKSAGMFYDQLKGFDYENMDIGAAAQKVQRSAFPDKYGKQVGTAQQMLADSLKRVGKNGGVGPTGLPSKSVTAADSASLNARQAIEDRQKALEVAELALKELDTKKNVSGSTRQAAENRVERAKRELEEAKAKSTLADARLEEAKVKATQAGAPTSGKASSGSSQEAGQQSKAGDPAELGKILGGGLLESLGFDGSLFENPMEWPFFKLLQNLMKIGPQSGGQSGGLLGALAGNGAGMFSNAPQAVAGGAADAVAGDGSGALIAGIGDYAVSAMQGAGPAAAVNDNSINITGNVGMNPQEVMTNVEKKQNERSRTYAVSGQR